MYFILYKKYYKGEKDEIAYTPAEQLFWREYFYQLSFKNEFFAQVDNNKMCFKIPWDYNGKQELFYKWENVSKFDSLKFFILLYAVDLNLIFLYEGSNWLSLD